MRPHSGANGTRCDEQPHNLQDASQKRCFILLLLVLSCSSLHTPHNRRAAPQQRNPWSTVPQQAALPHMLHDTQTHTTQPLRRTFTTMVTLADIQQQQQPQRQRTMRCARKRSLTTTEAQCRHIFVSRHTSTVHGRGRRNRVGNTATPVPTALMLTPRSA